LPTNVSGITVANNGTAAGVFGTGASGCDTASTAFIPCALPMIDTGNFSAPQVRNGTQYFVRVEFQDVQQNVTIDSAKFSRPATLSKR